MKSVEELQEESFLKHAGLEESPFVAADWATLFFFDYQIPREASTW